MDASLSLCAALVAFGSGHVSASPAIGLESLLDEMVDRDALARVPLPFYACRQASSYDRDTVAKDRPGWFANGDRSQFVRIDEKDGRREHVLLDVEGPGAIVRFWGTWHGPKGGLFSNGTLRISIDGSSEPAIAGPAADIISGGAIVGPPFGYSVSPETPYAQRGHNLYLPIPYARRCTITYRTEALVDRGGKEGEALYYQINYRTYEKGTQLSSFSMAELARLRPKIARIGERLMASGPSGTISIESGDLEGTIAPGASREASLRGPAAIRELAIRLEAKDAAQALRSTILRIAFDGEPCVWAPVGDFFGIGYRPNAVRTWYTRATREGEMRSFWVMPFEKSCRVALRNVGKEPVEVRLGRVRAGAWAWDDRSMHFSASWRQWSGIDTGPDKDMTGDGAFDVNYVEVRGTGRYVGDALAIFNGIDAWWGEGDEKIYVDGEAFPSHIGTGTEDYYGYAWCKPAPFSMPFHAQPDGAGNLKAGFSVNARYRSLDAIPFRSSIVVDMELWHRRKTRMNFAPTAFWYARPGAVRNVKPDPEEAAKKVALSPEDLPK